MNRKLLWRSYRKSSKPVYTLGYIEHVVFWIVHDVGGKGIEGKEISYFDLLLSVLYLGFAYHVGVYDFVPG